MFTQIRRRFSKRRGMRKTVPLRRDITASAGHAVIGSDASGHTKRRAVHAARCVAFHWNDPAARRLFHAFIPRIFLFCITPVVYCKSMRTGETALLRFFEYRFTLAKRRLRPQPPIHQKGTSQAYLRNPVDYLRSCFLYRGGFRRKESRLAETAACRAFLGGASVRYRGHAADEQGRGKFVDFRFSRHYRSDRHRSDGHTRRLGHRHINRSRRKQKAEFPQVERLGLGYLAGSVSVRHDLRNDEYNSLSGSAF